MTLTTHMKTRLAEDKTSDVVLDPTYQGQKVRLPVTQLARTRAQAGKGAFGSKGQVTLFMTGPAHGSTACCFCGSEAHGLTLAEQFSNTSEYS